MAKSLYIGVDGKARKVKAMWIGVNGVARKIKAGFIGVSDKARQFFSEMSNFTLKQYIVNPASLYSNGPVCVEKLDNNLIFLENNNGLGTYPVVINSNLTVKYADWSSGPQPKGPASATIGNYALFVGGYDRFSGSSSVSAQAVTTTLTTKKFTLQKKSTGKAGISLPSYAIFGGGITSGVEAYNSSLVYKNVSGSTIDEDYVRGGLYKNEAVFVGYHSSNKMKVYTNSLTYSYKGIRNVNCGLPTVVEYNDKLFVAGGMYRSSIYNNIDVFDSNYTRTTSLTHGVNNCFYLSGIVFKDKLYFIEGNYNNDQIISKIYNIEDDTKLKVDIFDKNLVRTSMVLEDSSAGSENRLFGVIDNYLIDYAIKDKTFGVWEN